MSATRDAAVTAGVLDRSYLDSLRDLEDGVTIVQLVVREFLQETPERLKVLEDAIVQEDPVAIARASHSLRGMCGALGARTLGTTAGRIEEAAREGRLEPCHAELARMKREYEVVRLVFEAELSPTYDGLS